MTRYLTFLFAVFLIFSPGFAQSENADDAPSPAENAAESTRDTASTEGRDGSDSAAPRQDAPQPLTEAQRITRLERTVEEGEELLAELNGRLERQQTDPESEYFKAQKEFNELDKQLENLKEERENAATGPATEQIDANLESLERQWQLARDRFDLAIEERKAVQAQKAALEQKLQQDKAALERLIAPPTTRPAATETPAPATPVPATSPETEEPADTPAAAPPAESAAPPDDATPPAGRASPDKPPSEELIKATEELEDKKFQAEEAEQEVRSLTERIESLEKSIEAQEKQLETARRRVNVARETESELSKSLQKLIDEGAGQADIQNLRTRIEDARQRFRTAQQEASQLRDRLITLERQRNDLLAEQLAAQVRADESRRAEEEAQKKLEKIQNPFSIQNMKIWIVAHGPRLAGIIIGIFVALFLLRIADKRIVAVLVGRSDRGSRAERENRAKTLSSVFHNAATIIIIAGGILMVLDEIGIPIAPLLGGAAVFGLAIAFGAQNLVRDYFSGFMILMENQYGINDVVKIAGTAGLVERVTLRVTTLRDLEGIAHFIPNGQITTVSNMTHGWSRALFDIGVSYNEDVDQVMSVLVDLGKEMRKDPDFSKLILDDPEMLGVDSFGDSAVVIKFFIKTKPLQQWTVKRQLLRRIKKKFDELGIEIPFPHRTIYHRTEEDVTPRVYFEEQSPVGRNKSDSDQA